MTEAAVLPGRLAGLARRMGRTVGQGAVAAAWPAYSRLLLVSDSERWSVNWDLLELAALAGRLGVKTMRGAWPLAARRQSVFLGSHFLLLDDKLLARPHRFGTTYFHGRPGQGSREFDAAFDHLLTYRDRLERIQVTNRPIRDLLLNAGLAAEKVFLIRIGINLAFFSLQTPESRRAARERLGLPQTAVVIGSFQKDGVGWEEGREPKLIKGPDVLLEVVARLREKVPELHVLLSGPARGYVKMGLERLGVPFRHVYLDHYPDVGRLYQALDLYLVTSREEGGPKAVLESMASGVPLVSTRVGQAADLIDHGHNGYLVEVGDVEALAHFALRALADRLSLGPLLAEGRRTAAANAYERQAPLWAELLRGFVALPESA